MLIGQTEVPVLQLALSFLIIFFLILNSILFNRGNNTYSISYELMLANKFIRQHRRLRNFISVCYKLSFLMPFLLLFITVIFRFISNFLQGFPLLFNGLIILLQFYPFKRIYYFRKEIALWACATASQLTSLFLSVLLTDTAAIYTSFSAIFQVCSAMLLCFAILAQQTAYWDISMAMEVCQSELSKVFNKLPVSPLFDGGIYKSIKGKFFIFYIFNIVFLVINAVLIYLFNSSLLGVVSLVSNLIYDAFILSFQTLNRPIFHSFVLIFLGRVLSFAFGEELWLFGYCVLYLFVGIFLGNLIIDKRFPLRASGSKLQSKQNALKTPQCVLFLLTMEVIIMVIFSIYWGTATVNDLVVNNVRIPLWTGAVLIIIATWVILFYRATLRILERHNAHLHSAYYFGWQFIRQHHIFMGVTYILILALGLYCLLFLHSKTAFLSTIFLPAVYTTLYMMNAAWSTNNYAALADIDDYNKSIKKKQLILTKRREIMRRKSDGVDLQQSLRSFKQVPQHNDTNPLTHTMERVLRRKRLSSLKKDSIKEDNNTVNIDKFMTKNQLVPVKSKFSDGVFEGESIADKSQNSIQPGENEQCMTEDNQGIQEQFNKLKDWRSESLSCSELWQNLTPSDKRMILSFTTLILLLVGFGASCYLYADTYFGISVAIAMISLLTLSPFLKQTKCVSEFTLTETITVCGGCAAAITYWLIYYIVIQEQQSVQTVYGLVWAGLYILGACYLFAILALQTTEYKPKIILLSLISASLGFTAYSTFLISITATVILAFVFFILIIICIPLYYYVSQSHIPTWAKVVPAFIIGSLLITLTVASLYFNLTTNFTVFSFFMGALLFFTLIPAVTIHIMKDRNKYTSPLVYSAYGLPIYCFDSAQERLHSSSSHKVLYQLANTILIIYSSIVALLFITEQSLPIFTLAIFLSVNYFQRVLFSIKTYYEIAKRVGQLSDALLKEALHQVTHKYMAEEIDSRTTQQIQAEIDEIKVQIKKDLQEEYLDNKLQEMATLHYEYERNVKEEQKFLFFWLAILQLHLFAQEKANMVKYINMVRDMEEELSKVGILIQSSHIHLDFESKYLLILKEIQSLPPLQYLLYNEVQHNYQLRKAAEQEQLERARQMESIEQLKKESILYDKMQEKQAQGSSIAAFALLMKHLPSKTLYTDKGFEGDECLGTLAAKVSGWRRPSVEQMLCKDTFSVYDVKQGNIGDCYLISSIGVLGHEWMCKAFGVQEWKNGKGAYMIRFHKFLREVFIIIDDRLPVDSQSQLVFARSQDTKQIWPALLEKAYAKLYGGYSNIVQGKCHQVMAELTGGFPIEYALAQFINNPMGLWSKIINGVSNKYLLAAGSNPHPDGDATVSPGGIVQGHAYSIIEAREAEGYHLIKLKNPHGAGGTEWKGDFSDDSQLMTKRLMTLLNYTPADDGVFWMKLDDFLNQYKFLYLCAVFDNSWKKLVSIAGQFTKQNSFGTPNKSTKTHLNPQYGITVMKKCSLFVSFTQEAKSALIGMTYIYLRMQRNNGKRIGKHNISSDLLCGPPLSPINAVTTSVEFPLEASSYPYTFTLFTSCKEQGECTKFTLQMYCNDPCSEIILDQHFDRQIS